MPYGLLLLFITLSIFSNSCYSIAQVEKLPECETVSPKLFIRNGTSSYNSTKISAPSAESETREFYRIRRRVERQNSQNLDNGESAARYVIQSLMNLKTGDDFSPYFFKI